MAKRKGKTIPNPIRSEDFEKLRGIIYEAVMEFEGQADELESAIGSLFFGLFYGWRVLYVVHSKRTIRKYEAILGVQFREVLPETTAFSNQSLGFEIVEKVSNFWKAVGGPLENRRAIKRID